MYDREDLEARLNQLKEYHARSVWQRDSLLDKQSELNKEIAVINEDLLIFEKARVFLQQVSETARKAAKERLEEVVTNALQYVLGPEYSFSISLRQNVLGRPEADFLVVTKMGSKTIESLPTLGKGGGVIDVLAVALKFAMLELEASAGIIWLDEPFKHVSEEYVESAGRLLQFMGSTSDRQIVTITHNPRFAEMCNKRILLTQRKGISEVK